MRRKNPLSRGPLLIETGAGGHQNQHRAGRGSFSGGAGRGMDIKDRYRKERAITPKGFGSSSKKA